MWYCDGCRSNKTLSEQEVADSFRAAAHFIESRVFNPNVLRDVIVEVFCPVCLRRAEEFWLDKMNVYQEAWKVFVARMDNHRARFWAPAKPIAAVAAKR